MKPLLLCCVACLGLAFGAASVRAAVPATYAELSPGEVAWVLDHPHLRAASLGDAGPYEFVDPQQGLSGIANDVLTRAAVRVGLVPQVRVMPAAERDRALRRGDIAVATGIAGEGRQALSRSWLQVHDVLVTRVGNEGIRHLPDLRGRRVAVRADSAAAGLLRADYPQIQLLEVETAREGLQLLVAGRVDAWAGDQFTAGWLVRRETLSGLQIAGFLASGPHDLHFRVPEDQPVILKLLDKGLATITPAEMREILGRYVDRDWLGKSPEFLLQPQERAWLAEHRYLRVGVSDAWKPFGFRDAAGSFQGIAAAYLDELAARLGVAMAPVRFAATDQGMLDALRNGDVDLVPMLAKHGEWRGDAELTPVWISDPLVLVGRADSAMIRRLGMLAGEPLAMLESRVMPRGPEQDHPDILYHYRRQPADVLRAVQRGEVRAGLLNLATVNQLMRAPEFDGLRIVAPTPYEYQFVMAVRADWPQLAVLLQRGLQSLDQADHAALVTPWLETGPRRLPMPEPGGFRFLAWAAAVLLALCALLAYRYRRLSWAQLRLAWHLRRPVATTGARESGSGKHYADRLAWLQHCLRRLARERPPQPQVDVVGADAFRDLLRVEPVQQLFSAMCDVLGVEAALSDGTGNVLTTRSWRARFGRLPDTDSDLFAGRARPVETAFSGIRLYRCDDGAMACRAEIHEGRRVVAEIAVAGFHLDAPDLAWMCKQMPRTNQYRLLRRLAELPLLDQDRLRQVLRFLRGYVMVLRSMSGMLAESRRQQDILSLQARFLEDARRRDMDLLAELEQLGRELLARMPDDGEQLAESYRLARAMAHEIVYVSDLDGAFRHVSEPLARHWAESGLVLSGNSMQRPSGHPLLRELAAADARLLAAAQDAAAIDGQATDGHGAGLVFDRIPLRGAGGGAIGVLAIGRQASAVVRAPDTSPAADCVIRPRLSLVDAGPGDGAGSTVAGDALQALRQQLATGDPAARSTLEHLRREVRGGAAGAAISGALQALARDDFAGALELVDTLSDPDDNVAEA